MAIQGVSNLLTTSLGRSQQNLAFFAAQIASGDRLQRPSFDPGAFVASERILSDLGGLDGANASLQRGQSLLSFAEAGLSGVNDQLNDIRRLTIQSFNAVGSDRDAIQGALNNSINQIERDLGSLRFAGQPLQNAAFRVENDSADVLSRVEFTRSPSPVGDGIAVGVQIRSLGSEALSTVTGAAALSAGGDVEFEVRGDEGSANIRVAQGADEASFAAAINAQRERTGVEASVSGADVEIRSVVAGSNQVLEVRDLNGSGISGTGSFRGSDADVSVNGVNAQSRGNSVRFDANGLVGSFNIDVGTGANTSTELNIVGGGVTLPIDGQGRTATFGSSAFSGGLGSSSGIGSLSDLRSGGSLSNASLGDRLSVLDAAGDEILADRVQFGVAGSALARSQSFNESLSGELQRAFADIRGTNFAESITNFQQSAFQQRIQIALIRESNLTQASVLRLLSPLS